MVKIDVVNIEKKTKRFIWPIIGVGIIIIGVILIAEYIIHFVKIFIAVVLIGAGIVMIFRNKSIKNFLFFRF